MITKTEIKENIQILKDWILSKEPYHFLLTAVDSEKRAYESLLVMADETESETVENKIPTFFINQIKRSEI